MCVSTQNDEKTYVKNLVKCVRTPWRGSRWTQRQEVTRKGKKKKLWKLFSQHFFWGFIFFLCYFIMWRMYLGCVLINLKYSFCHMRAQTAKVSKWRECESVSVCICTDVYLYTVWLLSFFFLGISLFSSCVSNSFCQGIIIPALSDKCFNCSTFR